MMIYYQLNPYEQISVKVENKIVSIEGNFSKNVKKMPTILVLELISLTIVSFLFRIEKK